jgi:large exoprotein involved in heme utilization and adhesion
MAVTVTNTEYETLNTCQTLTANAATSTVSGASEVFTYTPSKGTGKIALIMQSSSTGVVPAKYTIAAGDLWAAGALTGTIGSTTAAAGIKVLEFETAKVLKKDGTIAITVSPGDTTTTKLKTNHAFKLYALELL